MGDWLLRVSGGDTKRVNSANPIAPGARPEAVLNTAEALYAKQGLPVRFRLTPLADSDADTVLAEAGYEALDRSWTMVAPLSARPDDPELRVVHVPDPAFQWLGGRAISASTIHLALLAAIPGAKAFATLLVEGRPVAAGYASTGDGRAQLSDIVVAAEVRGRGFGRRLVAGLLGWAWQQGCREALLQVLADNAPARGLYRSLGFRDAYPYHYRVRR